MKSFLTFLVLILLGFVFWTRGIGSDAHLRTFDKCPRITVESSVDVVDAGTPINFIAKIDNVSAVRSHSFNWVVSAGTITHGEGTSEITVDSTGLGGQTIKATVEIGGFPTECANSESSIAAVRSEIFCRRPFDEYGDIHVNDEGARLDNFAIALQNEPEARGYIMVYAARRFTLNEARTRASRTKKYLVNTREINAGRIVIVYCGYGEEMIKQLYVVPSGAEAPSCRE